MCCKLARPPEPLSSLLSGTDAGIRRFKEIIRVYNRIFQLASSGADVAPLTDANAHASGVQSFRIHANVFHHLGPLQPDAPGDAPRFAQPYICDDDELEQRRVAFARARGCDDGVLQEL